MTWLGGYAGVKMNLRDVGDDEERDYAGLKIN